MKKLAIDALKHQYTAQMKNAEYTLENYLSNPAAIGEHPNLLAEMDTALESWVSANDKLAAISFLTIGDIDGVEEESAIFEELD
jgi:hypothetical protein